MGARPLGHFLTSLMSSPILGHAQCAVDTKISGSLKYTDKFASIPGMCLHQLRHCLIREGSSGLQWRLYPLFSVSFTCVCSCLPRSVSHSGPFPCYILSLCKCRLYVLFASVPSTQALDTCVEWMPRKGQGS